MDIEQLKSRLRNKTELDSLVSEAIINPVVISDLLMITNIEKGSLKFQCTKVVRLVSEQKPTSVYPFFKEITGLIYSRNSFVKWDGILILSNLISVDTEGKFDVIYQDYFDLIRDPQMITAANVVKNAWKFILSNPELERDITGRLLEIPGINYYNKGEPSSECNNVLCSHVIDCFARYYSISSRKKEILSFVRGQLKNTRKQVVKKAEMFIKKHQADFSNIN